MGAEYRAGHYYGSSTTINDNAIAEDSTWSSEKIFGLIDDRNISEGKTWSSDKIDSTKADNSVIAPVESESTASQAYAIGEHFIRDGAFCTAKTAIAQGEAFTLNTNYMAGNIGARVAALEEVTTTKLDNNTNIDTVPHQYFKTYMCDLWTNIPTGIQTNGTVLIIPRAGNNAIQIYICPNIDDGIYVRSRFSSGSYGSWKRFDLLGV